MKKLIKSKLIIIISLISVVCIGVGSTVAYLIANSQTENNKFIPAYVTCEIDKTTNGALINNVSVKNTGNIDAYIRAAVIVTWVSDSNGKILSEAPLNGVDYTISWGGGNWFQGTDDYWYHSTPIQPQTNTAVLLVDTQALTQKKGYTLNFKVVATAIQSNPERVVTDEWGVTLNNGNIISR